MIQHVTVYCASSSRLAAVYRDAALALGRAIALRGWGVIYGGDSAGLMGAVADGAFAAGGQRDRHHSRAIAGKHGQTRTLP